MNGKAIGLAALSVAVLGCDPTGPVPPIAIQVANEAPGTVADVSVWDFKTERYVYATTFPYGASSCGTLDDLADPISYKLKDTMRVEIAVTGEGGLSTSIVLGPFHQMTAQAWHVVLRADMTASLSPRGRVPC